MFAFDLRDLSLRPQLGKSLAMPDERTIVVTLQPTARWQDGRPVTAEEITKTYVAKTQQANSQYFKDLKPIPASCST